MRTAERILATRLWYRYARSLSATRGRADFIAMFKRFATVHSGSGLDRRLVCAWERGERSASAGMVRRVESEVAGAQCVFAVAVLLAPKRLSAPAAAKVVCSLHAQQPDGRRLWVLPCPGSDIPMGEGIAYAWDDSTSLAARGDFWGFLAVLALFRESVARSDFQRIDRYAHDLYSALPCIAGLGWVRPDVDLLLQCVEALMASTRRLFLPVIDWKAFRAQILNPVTWQGSPPWVVSPWSTAAVREAQTRPIPLLEDVEPLRPYVRIPTAADEGEQ